MKYENDWKYSLIDKMHLAAVNIILIDPPIQVGNAELTTVSSQDLHGLVW